MNAVQSVKSVSSATVYQVLGAVVPALIMLAVFPVVEAQLDERSFALFTFLFTAMSMLTVLDAGLGRAVTYFVARRLATGESVEALRALAAAIVLGAVFSLIIMLAGNIVMRGYPGAVTGVDLDVAINLLWFLPVFVLGSLLRGFLEAEHRFFAINLVQVCYGISYAVMPLIVMRWTQTADLYPWVLGVIRTAFTMVYIILIWSTQRNVGLVLRDLIPDVLKTFQYTRWLLLSNLIGIAIVFSDRIVISLNLPPHLVIAYLLPMEFLLRSQVLISAVCTVLFPNLVRMPLVSVSSLVRIAMMAQVIFAGFMLLCAFVVFPFVPALLATWMNPGFGELASPVVSIGLMGLMLIGCASLAMVVLHARGNTAAPAMLHGIELPFYFIGLYFASQTGQILPVLLIWLFRLFIDFLGMNYLLGRLDEKSLQSKIAMPKHGFWLVAGLIMLGYLAFVFFMPSSSGIFYWVAILVGILGCLWLISRGIEKFRKMLISADFDSKRYG